MAKIVSITGDGRVSIGTDTGGIIEATLADCAFPGAQVGEMVEVFQNEGKTIIHRAAPQPNAASTPNTAQTIAPSIIKGSSTKSVNKIVYGILAIFLGDLGVHKFYSGKASIGILYIVFCWTFIPGLFGLIEGIMGLTAPADAEGNIIV